MMKTLTHYPGVVNHLLSRTAHRAPARPRHIHPEPPAPRTTTFPNTGRERTRRLLPAATAFPACADFVFTRAPGHARIQWTQPAHPTLETHEHHTRLATFLRTAIPLGFILAIAFLMGCLAALVETTMRS